VRAERTTILSVWLDKPGTLYKEISFFEKEFTESLYRGALFSGRGDAIAFYMLFNKLNYHIKL
jgi:hypothetical protein